MPDTYAVPQMPYTTPAVVIGALLLVAAFIALLVGAVQSDRQVGQRTPQRTAPYRKAVTTGIVLISVGIPTLVGGIMFKASNDQEAYRTASDQNLVAIEQSVAQKYHAEIANTATVNDEQDLWSYVTANQTYKNIAVTSADQPARTCTLYTSTNPKNVLLTCGSKGVELAKYSN